MCSGCVFFRHAVEGSFEITEVQRPYLSASLSSPYHLCMQLLGIAASFFMVDSIGRRPLLIWGSLGSAIALGIVSLADALSIRWLLVSSMCAFIFFFSISW